jgi:HK97 family phage portal protein
MNLNPFKRKPKPVEHKSWTLTDEGWMNKGWDAGWWQQDRRPQTSGLNEAVEACVSTLSQTVAMCPIYHLEEKENGEAVRLKGSNAERVLYNPNDSMTRSQFFNSIIRCMYFSADGYAVATRNTTGTIRQLHLVDPKSAQPVADPDTGEVYYWMSPAYGREFNHETDNAYPQRDVLHLRINLDKNNPLKGETPLMTAANSIAANSAIVGSQAAFFNNQSKPSGVLSTPDSLNVEQMAALREALEAKTKGSASGGVPILGNGLKFESMALSSQDAQLVEAFSMTVESISRVFRVPLPLINSMQGSTFNNAEALMSWFLASGLGFLLEHIELELNKLFSLPFNQRLNFDTKALLRSDWKTQIETLGEGVLKGIYAPDEARAKLGMGPVPGGAGAEPRVQQQVVPLSAWEETMNNPPLTTPAEDPLVDEEEIEEEVEAALTSGIEKGLAYVS